VVNIANTPLNQRIKETSDKLYAAASQAGPGEVPLSVQVFEETIDLLQALIDVRTEQAEDLESAYESVGAEIETQAGLLEKIAALQSQLDAK